MNRLWGFWVEELGVCESGRRKRSGKSWGDFSGWFLGRVGEEGRDSFRFRSLFCYPNFLFLKNCFSLSIFLPPMHMAVGSLI